MIACLVVGSGIQMPLTDLITTMKDGFGNIMRSLGFIIVLGTTLGVLLEYTGSTTVMAHFILKKVGVKNPGFAMSITGFIVGLPIFCDSAFIMLSGLNKSLSIGAGSMMISHVNDAYFWVITKFSGLNIKAMLRVYSIATALMGLVALGMVYILSLILS
jgi:H+/gluconate symporter-like permease